MKKFKSVQGRKKLNKLKSFKNLNPIIRRRLFGKSKIVKDIVKEEVKEIIADGIYKNKLYKDGKPFNGISTSYFDKDKELFEKYCITDKLYMDYYAKDLDDVIPKHVLDTLGFYVDGNLFTGVKYGYTFKNGTTINGIYDGLLYKNGSVYTGSYNGRDFTDGVMDYVEEIVKDDSEELYEFIYISDVVKKYVKKIIGFFKK